MSNNQVVDSTLLRAMIMNSNESIAAPLFAVWQQPEILQTAH